MKLYIRNHPDEVTLPFTKNEQGLLEFALTEETLRDLVRIIQHRI